MPTVKIALRKGVTVGQHIRAGVTVFAGEPQTFDVTDEQLVAILDDPAFDVDETSIEETTTKPQTKAEKLEAAAAEGLELDVTDKNTHDEIDAAIEAARNAGSDDDEAGDGNDEAIDETLGDETPAGDGDDDAEPIKTGDESGDGKTTDETAANAADSKGARVKPGDASAPAGGSEESQGGDDFPADVNAIKRLNRAVVVAKAQSLGIEANYDEKNGATKGELANLIVEKLKA